MRNRCCESKFVCVSLLFIPCAANWPFRTPKITFCVKKVLWGDIFWLFMKEVLLEAVRHFMLVLSFLCVLSFHFSFNIVNYSSRWMCELHLQLFRSFECDFTDPHWNYFTFSLVSAILCWVSKSLDAFIRLLFFLCKPDPLNKISQGWACATGFQCLLKGMSGGRLGFHIHFHCYFPPKSTNL